MIHTILFAAILFLQVTEWLLHLGAISKGTYQLSAFATKLLSLTGMSEKLLITLERWFMIAVFALCFFFVAAMPTIILVIAVVIYAAFVVHATYEYAQAGKTTVASDTVVTTGTVAPVVATTPETLITKGITLLDDAKEKIETFVLAEFNQAALSNADTSDVMKLENALKNAVQHVINVLHATNSTATTPTNTTTTPPSAS